jgi:hypothetical protein
MDLVDQPGSEVEAAPAARGLAEMTVNLTRAAQPGGGRGADLTVAMTIANADEHGCSVYE